MKAILVFDVDERTYEAIKEHFTGDITLHLGSTVLCNFKNVVLQPMPKKFEMEYADWQEISKPYTTGWNNCIDEILGGKI